MTTKIRRAILRGDGCWLLLAALPALIMDIAGAFYGHGPQGVVLRSAPGAAIGFIEAHGLALILGVLLFCAAPTRAWHLTGAAIHILLGTANLVFWQLFATANILAVGYITTSLHFLFVVLQIAAAMGASKDESGAPRLAFGGGR